MRRLGARLPGTPSPCQPGSAQRSPSPRAALHTSLAHGAGTAASCAASGQETDGEILPGGGGGGRYRLITHGPFVLRVATSSSRLHPAPPPLPGRRALDEEEAPGPGRVHVYLVFPGRREAMHVVTAGQGVPRRHPRGSVMALQRQTRKADILPTGSTEA